MKEYRYYVYILTNFTNSVLYTGVTRDLVRRVEEHRSKRMTTSFTTRYNVYKLIYFEEFTDINEAIAWEKKLKKWKRQWKINLIKKQNSQFRDLISEVPY